MTVISGFLDHIGRLIHVDAQASDVLRARHRTFLLTRFGLFLAAMAAFLTALIAGHAPRPWEAMAVAWLTVPFVAATHVARTGRLDRGEIACLIAWWGLAMTTSLGGGTSLLGGCVLMLVIPLEASFSGRRGTVNLAVAAAIVGVAALAAAQMSGVLAPSSDRLAVGDVLVALPALLFVVVLAKASLALQRHRQHLVAVGEERYRVLSEAIGDLVLRYDRARGVVAAGREAEVLFGITPRDLIGRGLFERIHVGDRPAFLALFADAAETGENMSARLRLRTARPGVAEPDHPLFAWIEIRARRLDGKIGRWTERDGDGAGQMVVAVVRDITHQIEHEQAIEAAKREAERVSQWKDGFLANVSHELRTPLNAIIGFSEILSSPDLRPADPDKQRDYARIITTSGQHLLSVVNSLLDISKIEAGRFDLDPEPFGVAAMIHACCDMIRLQAEQQGVRLHAEIAPILGEIVADRRACRQIVINLLSNAMKFTPSGGEVEIQARIDGAAVVVTVADTGVGIAPYDLKHIGDAFFQAKAGLDRDYEGTGLGLSVVRGLVGLHGGSIAIASSPGEGTQVSVRLPVDCRTAAPSKAAAKIETISLYRRRKGSERPAPAAKVQQVA